MKKSLKSFLLLLVLLLVFVPTASAAELPQTNVIETSATSTVYVDPDIVQIKLSVRTEENNRILSQEKNAAAVNKVTDTLLNEGLNKDEIKTTSYGTYWYTKTVKEETGDNELKVYVTNSSLEITSKDLNKVGDILGAMAEITEVNVDSVNYSIQDPEKYKEQVITAAIAGAKQNILYSANALGVSMDHIVYLRIDYNPSLGINPYNRPGSSVDVRIPQPQNPDKITISATANMSYSVK